ncbi:MAG TPA: SGNH/GDSL hydrolase family protein [Mycobacterium sp.]
MKYFFAVLVSTMLLVSGCEEAPVVPPPKPSATPATLLPPPKPVVTHHILVIGDSITQGSGESSFAWPALIWSSLKSSVGIVVPIIAGEGASGYVHPGNTGSTFGERAALYTSPQDELVVFFGSSNDSVASPSVLASAVRDTFAKTKAAAPAAKLLVIGPVATSPNPPAAIARIPGILRDEAQAVGAVFVDPIAEGWLAANPEMIGSDGVHPNDAEQRFLAERIGPLIRNALQPSGGG